MDGKFDSKRLGIAIGRFCKATDKMLASATKEEYDEKIGRIIMDLAVEAYLAGRKDYIDETKRKARAK